MIRGIDGSLRGLHWKNFRPTLVLLDDLLKDESVVTEVVEYFNKHEDCMILTCKREVYDSTMSKCEKIMPSIKQVRFIKEKTPLQLFEILAESNFISGSCTVYTKKLFKAFGEFNEKYILLEDYPKYLYLTRNNVKIHYFDRIIIKYRLGGISTQKKINPILQKDFINVFYNEIKPFKEAGFFNKRKCKWNTIKRQKGNVNLKEMLAFPDVVLFKFLRKIISLGDE